MEEDKNSESCTYLISNGIYSNAHKPSTFDFPWSPRKWFVNLLKYYRTDNQPVKILENLYLGSIGASVFKQNLQNIGITHILIVAGQLSPVFPNDFIYKKLKIFDLPGSNIFSAFDEAFQFIDEGRAHGKVLVHCYAGRSRSGAVCVGYVMREKHLSLTDALSYVQEKRPKCLPNKGFMSQLKLYENTLARGY
ncbi:MKP2_13 [Blepharisma stoltei]|uniref:protein-tyrosine-phosphatase n=1 Tax=Blepharisma stoltei TaxID=1481888 RepID=A0AAU9K615_9CILI|nr:unnamed protein product [Blepharisma stoltei]